ncbi:NADPH-dependent FMN reductase [Schizosaccharomyces octosporus yFS286]|uniref:NADPH-dependent FMN reductase n=1 Tax=Schizosaccharomyces octosporus (strain yFS286) TaxID=483514 RepID=S9PR91_SCHOY|nr:NADPH-dependent FMN reductase [Schizosaccharomyces octosporus yFS286]EPX71686.1 NADPH-dependent FMN reductase [Schizosaccharomyces octosporus yFS286]
MLEKKIALITSSCRSTRLNPFITDYVRSVIASSNLPNGISVHTVDVKNFNLPIYNEPRVPVSLPKHDPTSYYQHETTRKWSLEIGIYDAYIFVTPQYNWSIPASLKNAIDFLFHEWTGKPAGIVTYGGHGGLKAASHLQDIIRGLRMQRVSTTPGLTITQKTLDDCIKHGHLDNELIQSWIGNGSDEVIREMWAEILQLLQLEP